VNRGFRTRFQASESPAPGRVDCPRLKLVAWVVSRTPLAVAAGFSVVVAWLWWLLVPIRRGLAIANFRKAFPGVSPGVPLRRMMSGLALGYFELLHEERVPGSVALSIEGSAAIVERGKAGKGTLIVAGHFGSWDLVGPLLVRRTGIKATVVVKIPRSRGVSELMERVRGSYGLGLLPNKAGTMPRVFELLEEGHAVVFVIDQRFARGVAVPFFGRFALTAPAVAVAAAKTSLPVHFLEYWREGTGRHRATISEPLPVTGIAEDDIAVFTARIEEAVRRRPHSWLWLHDRWKGAPAAV
jgi:Kdo2-lipid IVA lauroyltransferase/acyltransferase